MESQMIPLSLIKSPLIDEKGGVGGDARSGHDRDSPLDMSTDTVKPGGGGDEKRGAWSNHWDFLFSVIGFAVDLSNVFRFPYKCFANGGGAFLIPYTIMLVLCVIPMCGLEMIAGQYFQSGGLSLWTRICPGLKGIGVASALLNFYVGVFYNVIIVWAVYYFGISFFPAIRWVKCGMWWNTPHCWVANITANNTVANPFQPDTSAFPTAEYLEYNVLGMSNTTSMTNLGSIKWDLAMCSVVVYVVLYFCLFKGIKWLGKAVWPTAILPYVVLTIMLVRGLMLPGSGNGIRYFLKPDFSKLTDIGVWVDASAQIFFSVGIGFSVHIAYSSYNPFHNKVHRDCLVTALVNSFTSIFSGFVVFSYLGYMAEKAHTKIETVASKNPGLIFSVYPEALATLPYPQIWAVMFFLMLINLGLDSTFGALESLITSIRDEFNWALKRIKYDREFITFLVVLPLFLLSLPNVTQGGFFLVQFFDQYAASLSLLVVALFECIGLTWFFGVDKLSDGVKQMIGKRPPLIFRIVWKYVCPTLLLLVICLSFKTPMSDFKPLTIEITRGKIVYPSWSVIFGGLITLSSIIFIPIVFCVQLCCRTNSFSGYHQLTWRQRLGCLISPRDAHHEFLTTGKLDQFTLRHWFKI